MTDQKTLVFISPAFPANESETYWVPLQQLLVKEIKKQFPHLNIIVIAYHYPYEEKTYQWHGINVISINGRKLSLPIRLIRTWNNLKKINKENQVLGLFSFWCREGALVGKWFAKWHGLKHFTWICGQDARKNNKYVKWISPKSNELIALSDFIVSEFQKNHGVKPSHLIPSAIDPNLFPVSFPRDRDIDILAVGSLIPLKRYDIFISVIKQLTERLPNVSAAICGQGEEKENIQSQIDNANLGSQIILLEARPLEDVLKLMQRTKILLHPSGYEAFGTVCLEALYVGAHVISFTRPMKQDIRNWHIVTTEIEMIEKCSELLRNNLKYERVLVYSIDETARAFMKLLE